MDNDDKQVGQILSRRDVLKILGLGSAATLLVACAPDVVETLSPTLEPTSQIIPATQTMLPATQTVLQEATAITNIPVCVVRPELTQGPYFVDEMLNRSDIRQDTSDGSISQGSQFDLTFNVTQVNGNGCVPLASAQVDIWHCNAAGVYSDAVDRSFNTVGKTFLRGYQMTDVNGVAKFITIYPGWYPGRSIHIHFKIRLGSYQFTSQLFFDDSFSDTVFLQAPYITGNRTLNSQDGIFNNSGNLLTLLVNPTSTGYAATFDIGMQI